MSPQVSGNRAGALERLKVWKQATEFSSSGDWIFASPLKIGRLPYSYTGFWRELDRACKAAGLGQSGRTLSGILIACGLMRLGRR